MHSQVVVAAQPDSEVNQNEYNQISIAAIVSPDWHSLHICFSFL